MKTKLNHLIMALVWLEFTVFISPFSTALAQNTTNIFITSVSSTVSLSAGAGQNSAPYTNMTSTSLVFNFSDSEGASDPARGASASGSVSQQQSVLLMNDGTNSILYITGTASVSSSAAFFETSANYDSVGSASSAFSVTFNTTTTCAFIFQGSTSESPPYTYTENNNPFLSYPQCDVQLVGTGVKVVGEQPTTFDATPGSGPASGCSTGMLSGNVTFGSGAVADTTAELGWNDPSLVYPTSDMANAILNYSITVYPANPRPGVPDPSLPWTTSTPVLGINYDGTNVVLSWPDLYPNYLLTTATNLPSTNWTVVTPPPAIVGSQWQVTNSAPAGTQFYRLQGQ